MNTIALVHDWLTNMAGSEQVVERFLNVFPNAPLYTSMADRSNLSSLLANADIHTSFLQKKVKPGRTNHQKYLPFMPMAFESFDLNAYDVVLSSSTSCSKGIITNPRCVHICYCNTPPRYIWEFFYEYCQGMGALKRKLLLYYMNYLRTWDFAAAQRVDYFIANSKNVAGRIWKHYRRESTVIYPPVDTDFFTPGGKVEDYYLCVSRLVPYKRVDLAVQAFTRLGLPLVVIGDGSELDHMKGIAGPNIRFLGRQPDEVVREHMQSCRAFVFPGEEDFGIAPLEAQACGRPVIAFGKGGALETVLDGQTGIFFDPQTPEALEASVRRFEKLDFDSDLCRRNAERFCIERFDAQIRQFVEEKRVEHQQGVHWRCAEGFEPLD